MFDWQGTFAMAAGAISSGRCVSPGSSILDVPGAGVRRGRHQPAAHHQHGLGATGSDTASDTRGQAGDKDIKHGRSKRRKLWRYCRSVPLWSVAMVAHLSFHGAWMTKRLRMCDYTGAAYQIGAGDSPTLTKILVGDGDAVH